MPVPVLSRLVQFRAGEAPTAVLMFAYSFLAMTSYNIVKPLTKSKFIDDIGPQWMPLILLGAVFLIGLIMQAYSRASGRLPARLIVPVTLSALAVLLVTFHFVYGGQTGWVPVAFYVFGLLFGILVISQFWTIANDIYDTRQARRLFGFIGGGASLGGMFGSSITAFFQDLFRNQGELLLLSAAILLGCAWMVWFILQRQTVSAEHLAAAVDERGVGGGEALRMLRESRHLQIIALVIGLATMAAVIVEQQLNVVAKAEARDVSVFLAKVQFYLSLASFIIQVGFTTIIHRSFGLAVALLILPLGLGATAVLILTTGFIWAPAVGRVLDSSLRYSLDKTTREVLFLPLPSDLKRRAKPFVDVTVDRLGKALGALLLLILNPPWNPRLTWQQFSYASLAIIGVWIMTALLARREYLRTFRRSLGTREIEPAGVSVTVADAATIEALVEELAHPDEASVLYAIDMLEMLDRRNLITPLLLNHESPKVQARALKALELVRPDLAVRWIPAVERRLKDGDPDVRAAAVRALAKLSHKDAPALMHDFLKDADPGVMATAATVLADSPNPADPPIARDALLALLGDDRAQAAASRREAAAALARIRNPEFHLLLVPLLTDPDVGVAQQAIQSARKVGADPRFVPALVSLLGHRVLKSAARETLVNFGPDVIPALAHFLKDQDEHVWVRRHVPATLAALPHQESMDALCTALDDPDGFLRYKIIEGIETLKRSEPGLSLPRTVIEPLIIRETSRYYTYLSLRFNLMRHDAGAGGSLLVRALDDKLSRAMDRVYRLLGLIHPWEDIAAARESLEGGDALTRARAIEYLDNLLAGTIRRRVMPIIDDVPIAEKVRVANDVLRTRLRDMDDTLAQLIHESDPVVAGSAIEFVHRRRRWSLADDLQHVASHGGRDRLVAEAASSALADRQAELGGSAPESNGTLPVVILADRLRAIPLFDFVSVDEIFRIAATGRQVRYDAGRPLHETGAEADDVHFLIEGAVRVGGNGSTAEVAAPAALAFEDMLEGRPVRDEISAARPSVALCLSRASLLTMMADNIVLARGLFCMLMTSGTGASPNGSAGHGGAPFPAVQPPLEAIEKARLLRHSPAFSRASVEQLVDLVAIAQEIELVEGAELFGPARTPAVYYVLRGSVTLQCPDAPPRVFGPGGTIGLTETLAGRPMSGRAHVTASGYALRMEQAALFEVLTDHVDLLQGLFSGVLRGASPLPLHDSPYRSR